MPTPTDTQIEDWLCGLGFAGPASSFLVEQFLRSGGTGDASNLSVTSETDDTTQTLAAWTQDIEDVTTDASSLLVTATGTPTARTLASRFATLRDIRDYGAVAGSDSGQAIQDALDDSSDGDAVFIPRGTFLLPSTAMGSDSTSILTYPNGKRVNIIGLGMGTSVLAIHASTASNMNILRGALTTSTFGIQFDSFGIYNTAGTAAGYDAIQFDFTDSDAVLVYQVLFRNLRLATKSATGGTGLRVVANSTSASGGMAYSAVSECLLDGVWFENVGDNMAIDHSTLIPSQATQPNPTIYALNVDGAENLDITRNVIAGLNTMIHVAGGVAPVIMMNWCEAPFGIATQSVNNAMIDIAGDESDVKHARIIANTCQSNLDTGLPNPVRLDNSIQAYVDGNRLWTYNNYPAIKITANAEDTIVGPNTYEQGNVVKYQEDCVQDLGARTLFVLEWRSTFVPAISFGGGTTGITYTSRTGTVTKSQDTVSFVINIVLSNKGSSTGSLAIGTLPYNAGETTACEVNINTVTSGVGDTYIDCQLGAGAGGLSIRKMATGSMTTLTDADVTNTTSIRIAGTYQVA